MKVKADALLPLVLDFAESFLSEGDFEVLREALDKDVSNSYKDNCLVKEGGLKAILSVRIERNSTLGDGIV